MANSPSPETLTKMELQFKPPIKVMSGIELTLLFVLIAGSQFLALEKVHHGSNQKCDDGGLGPAKRL